MQEFDEIIYRLAAILIIIICVVCLANGFKRLMIRWKRSRHPTVEAYELTIGSQSLQQVTTHNRHLNSDINQAIETSFESWNFPITLTKAESITSLEGNQLCFWSSEKLQANKDLPFNKMYAYFEIKLLSIERETKLRIGVAPRDIKELINGDVIYNSINNRYNSDSIMIHSATGQVYLGTKPIEWFPKHSFSTGDVIGCLVTRHTPPSIQFVINGEPLPSVPLPSPLIRLAPTIECMGRALLLYTFGRTEFLYSKANVFRYGLVPFEADDEMPPAYLNDSDGQVRA